MDLLVVLQNAYYRQGETYTRKQWLLELNRSVTGKRLAEMLPIGIDNRIINSSQYIGDHPDSYFDADINYLIAEIMQHRPKIILACGECAQKGLAKILTPAKIIVTYHPAYRRLTKKITRNVKNEILKTLEEIYSTNIENTLYPTDYLELVSKEIETVMTVVK